MRLKIMIGTKVYWFRVYLCSIHMPHFMHVQFLYGLVRIVAGVSNATKIYTSPLRL